MGVHQRVFPSQSGLRARPRLLWINCRLLHPLIGGDRLRTYHMLRLLKAGFEITYVCPTTPDDPAESLEMAGEYCDHLVAVPHRFARRGSLEFMWGALANSLWGKLPYMARRYVSKELSAWLTDNALGSQFDLIVCDYLVSWVHLSSATAPPQTPVVVFQHNVESLIWRRHAATVRNPVKRWIFQQEARLTFQMESACDRSTSGQVTVSPEETHYFKVERGMSRVLGDVPTGVDAEYFRPARPGNFRTLAFLGSMDWEANCQAVRQFVHESLPQIREEFPDVRFLVIGRNPPADLRELADKDPGIVVTGTVPDVRPHLAEASIMVLPLRVGGGTRIKVFEAMAAGLAVVSTAVGVEGLPVTHDQDVLIAESGEDFVRATLTLLRDPARCKAIGMQGRKLVEENFSWHTAAQRFKALCSPLIKPSPSSN